MKSTKINLPLTVRITIVIKIQRFMKENTGPVYTNSVPQSAFIMARVVAKKRTKVSDDLE